jgi:hypothetical protein
MSTHPPFRRLIACILPPTYLAACSSWKTQELSPEQVIAQEHPDKVLVKLADGAKLVLTEPQVSGDTLMGIEGTEQRHIPLASVSAIELKESDAALTTAFVFGTVVVVGGLAALITYAAVCGGSSDIC